jgi:hypothetical protein
VLDKERAFKKNAYGDPKSIEFAIESETALSPKYIFSKAIEILIAKTHKTMEEIYRDDSSYVQFVRTDTGGGQFTFNDEDDTFGNTIQSLMHNHYIRDKKPTVRNIAVTYIGYCCPHPLDNTMVVRINLDDQAEASDMDYIDMMKEHCERSLIYLQNIQSEWQMSAI